MRLKRLGLPAFLLTLILLCSISVHTLYKIRDYGTLINYVGIVRGASQRLVKLELTDQPNDELKDYIDEILTELDMGVGKGDPVTPVSHFIQNGKMSIIESMG